MAQLGTGAASAGKMTMTRALHKGCPNCFAPGTYSDSPLIRDGYTDEQVSELIANHPELASKANHFRRGWKEVYDPARSGQPVGLVCPCCASDRPGPKKLQTMKIKGRLW